MTQMQTARFASAGLRVSTSMESDLWKLSVLCYKCAEKEISSYRYETLTPRERQNINVS